MNKENIKTRKDIDMVKNDIRLSGEEEVITGIEGIPLAEARLYYRNIYKLAIREFYNEE